MRGDMSCEATTSSLDSIHGNCATSAIGTVSLLYSRKIVGWEVYAEESGEHAASLLQRTALGEAIQTWRAPLVLHADNGSPMKSATLLVTLQWLGVTP